MSKLSDFMSGLLNKVKALSRTAKIIAAISLSAVIIIIVYIFMQANAVKYSVLFSNLSTDDQKQIQQALTSAKVTAKYAGNTVLVPSDKVDELRFQLASTITGGSKGWELFDSANSFSSTDTDEKVKFLQAQSGELEKTLKSFPQVENAKVNLVLPEDSVFVKDSTEASASVALKMKNGQKLSDENIKAIISLVSASVKNLPKKNVQVIDDKMTLLSNPSLIDDDSSNDISNSSDKQQTAKKNFEKSLEDKVMEQLGLPYKDKVSVKINADMNFDAVTEDKTTVAPTGTEVSSHINTSTSSPINTNTTSSHTTTANGTSDALNTTTTGNASQGTTTTAATTTNGSPVDSNSVNSETVATTPNVVTTTKDATINYDYSKTNDKIIKAPGEINRLTASVIIDDGNLDSATKATISNIVSAAIGFNSQRGDVVSVEGLAFDTSAQKAAQKTISDMNKLEQKQQQMNLIKYILVGLGALFLLVILIASLRKNAKKEKESPEFDMGPQNEGIDVLIDDNIDGIGEQVKYKPIDFENEEINEKTHIESEIKRYATEKPEQVADIIKSWLAEDER